MVDCRKYQTVYRNGTKCLFGGMFCYEYIEPYEEIPKKLGNTRVIYLVEKYTTKTHKEQCGVAIIRNNITETIGAFY